MQHYLFKSKLEQFTGKKKLPAILENQMLSACRTSGPLTIDPHLGSCSVLGVIMSHPHFHEEVYACNGKYV